MPFFFLLLDSWLEFDAAAGVVELAVPAAGVESVAAGVEY